MTHPTHTPETFKPLLLKLVKTPEYFTTSDLREALEHVFTQDAALPTQIGAFLTGLHLHRVEKRPEQLATAAQFLRERALKALVEGGNEDFVVDMVGTGGDGHNVFNVSTTAAIVAAGAGARVVKHGSRASTSSSGSADLLQALGCHFVAPESGSASAPIPRAPFAFILAPHFHPSLAQIAPHRKALPFRTMFNVLGPLINPARPKGMVLGVAERHLGPTFAESLKDGGVQRALVVCGAENLDEISCAGQTYAWELQDGRITERMIHPSDFGVSTHTLDSVKGASPQENAVTFKAVLTSADQVPEKLKPVFDFVTINAAALIYVAGLAANFEEAAGLARKSIVSGEAWKAFTIFRDQGLDLKA